MSSSPMHQLYRRWIDEVWTASPGALTAVVAEDFIGHWPERTVTGRWIGRGKTIDGEMRLSGNDVMRTVNGRVAEYWVESTAAPVP